MLVKTIKYFSTIIVAVVAVLAERWLRSYYIQSPWTRDRKVCAEQVSITSQVSGRIIELNIKDNQLVNAGDLLFTIDKTPFQITGPNAQVQLAKAQSGLAEANSETSHCRHLSRNFISTGELGTTNLNVKAMQTSIDTAQATLKRVQWQLTQTGIRAPVSGWMTNLTTRIGDYASIGKPLFAPIDNHSFYVIGYLEETKLYHIHEGASAQITLYSGNKTLQGYVSSIGWAIYDQSVEGDSSLIPDVKPNVPWVRLAQRIPVRFTLDKVPGDVTLVSGTTCSIAAGQ